MPFGDITTLMVWQAGKLAFDEFSALLLPSLITWLVPALAMSVFLEPGHPAVAEGPVTRVRTGTRVVFGLFLISIGLAVFMHNVMHLPAVLGMMAGLGLLCG